MGTIGPTFCFQNCSVLVDKVRMKNMSALITFSWCTECLRFVPLITSLVWGEI